MTDRPTTRITKKDPAPSAKELVEQLSSLIADSGTEVASERLDRLEERVEGLARQVANAGAGGVSEAGLAEKLKKLFSSILLESGVLEKLIASKVEQMLGAAAGGGLSKTIQGAVQKEIEGYLGSEAIKELLDEKFRAVTLYLKTDVIPHAVRHALKDHELA